MRKYDAGSDTTRQNLDAPAGSSSVDFSVFLSLHKDKSSVNDRQCKQKPLLEFEECLPVIALMRECNSNKRRNRNGEISVAGY